MSRKAVATASPSLALVKYWGKEPGGINLPATSNLAVGLDALHTRTTVTLLDPGTSATPADRVTINETEQEIDPYLPVLDALRSAAGTRARFAVDSTNTFPTGAGIASSSSGFAALTLALDALLETHLPTEHLSAIARLGSGSASRAVYGGFTSWKRGAGHATRYLPADHWPELRVVVAVLSAAQKSLGSRAAMERSRLTSGMYSSWVEQSAKRYEEACTALSSRDLERLGTVMRESYLSMFATMFTAQPPYIYWLPQSVALLHELEQLRARGVSAWETMDAGPQVKIITTASDLDRVIDLVEASVPDARVITTMVGGEPKVSTFEEGQA